MSGARDIEAPTRVPAQATPTTAARVGARPIRRPGGAAVIQAKLVVGDAEDVHEREADRVADEVMRVLDTSSPVRVADAATANGGKIQSNPYGSGRSIDAGGGPLARSVQRKTAPVAESLLADDSGTIRRAGLWDWLWGGAPDTVKKGGEIMDTGSAGLETLDETHKAVKGLTESGLVGEGMLKNGGDYAGITGGLIGGGKDLIEGGSQIKEEGVGVRSGLKVVGGTAGVVGAGNKALGVFGGEQAEELIKKTVGIGGEQVAGWLDFISGGTKALSGAYLTGTSQLQYNKVKAVHGRTRIPEVKTAAAGLMEIINENWYLGMWDVGMGSMDMAASYSVPGYVAVSKATSLTSKLAGGDILWSALSWASGGKVRTNDQIEQQIKTKIDQLSSAATDLATKALRGTGSADLTVLHAVATEVAPDYAEKLSNAVKTLPRKEFHQAKQALKGTVWN